MHDLRESTLGNLVQQDFLHKTRGLIRGEKRGRKAQSRNFTRVPESAQHNSELAGPQGEKRTFLQIRDTFFWPGMKNEISRWVKACLACRKRKTPRPIRAGATVPKQASFPNEVVAIDIYGPFPRSEKGNVWILQ